MSCAADLDFMTHLLHLKKVKMKMHAHLPFLEEGEVQQ
jgi:hypothetical protein